MADELKKDPMFFTKSTKRGKDKSGRDLLQVSLTPEIAGEVLVAIAAAIDEGKERGVKLSFHTSEKDGPRGKFDSCFFFVKAIQEFGAFDKKPAGQTEDMKARIEKVKQSMAPKV